MAPYSGTIGARVEQLEPGHGVVVLKQHHRIQNHLDSVHAIALINLAELVTGLTLMNTLPAGMRGILVAIEMEYLKKARGRLRAECFCTIPKLASDQVEDQEIPVVGDILDSAGEVVARGRAKWRIGLEAR